MRRHEPLPRTTDFHLTLERASRARPRGTAADGSSGLAPSCISSVTQQVGLEREKPLQDGQLAVPGGCLPGSGAYPEPGGRQRQLSARRCAPVLECGRPGAERAGGRYPVRPPAPSNGFSCRGSSLRQHLAKAVITHDGSAEDPPRLAAGLDANKRTAAHLIAIAYGFSHSVGSPPRGSREPDGIAKRASEVRANFDQLGRPLQSLQADRIATLDGLEDGEHRHPQTTGCVGPQPRSVATGSVMVVHLPVILPLLVAMVVLVKTSGLRLAHAVACVLLGFFLAGSRAGPGIDQFLKSLADALERARL